MVDRADGETPSVALAASLGGVEDIAVERPVEVLPGACHRQGFAPQYELNDASFLPRLANERAGVELDAVEVDLVDVARVPREPPRDQAAGATWPAARRFLAADRTHCTNVW